MSLNQIQIPDDKDDPDTHIRSGGTMPNPEPVENGGAGGSPNKKPSALDKLRAMNAVNQLDEMREIMENSVFIILDMIMTGTLSVFFAYPNGGKTLMTLYFLREAIRHKRMKPEDIYYINADDSYSGLCEKTEIAKEMGFNIISPDQQGITIDEMIATLLEMAEDDEVHGTIFVLDTLKKFTEVLDKRSLKEFFRVCRRITTRGGTVLLLGHPNKHMEDGRMIFEGCGDVKTDIDIMYAIYNLSDRDQEDQMIEFRCEKDRGRIAQKMSFSYEKRQDMSYVDILNSVKKVEGAEAAKAKRESYLKEKRVEFSSVIHFVHEVLADGPKNESEIKKALKDGKIATAAEVTRSALEKGLETLTGDLWDMERIKAQGNSKVYSLVGSGADAYRKAKGGY